MCSIWLYVNVSLNCGHSGGGVGGADQASEFLHPRADVQFFLKFICMWVLHSVFDLHVSAVTIICKCLPDCVMNTYQG